MIDTVLGPILLEDGADPIDRTVIRGFTTYHFGFEQHSGEWMDARRGKLTASEVKLILTPTLKVAANDRQRQHVWEIAAQRITGYTEPSFIGDDMQRGLDDESDAIDLYSKQVLPVEKCGFVTSNKWGFTLGYSPDGLVGEHGLIEIKSRRQKYQLQTIVQHAAAGTIPPEYMLQCQAALLITERKWLDFISYSGGMPMIVIRVYPDEKFRRAIVDAADAFETSVQDILREYHAVLASPEVRATPTERKERQEII